VTVTPLPCVSIHNASESDGRYALLAAYVARFGNVWKAEVDATLSNRPEQTLEHRSQEQPGERSAGVHVDVEQLHLLHARRGRPALAAGRPHGVRGVGGFRQRHGVLQD
jgi:hypothetical protein